MGSMHFRNYSIRKEYSYKVNDTFKLEKSFYQNKDWNSATRWRCTTTLQPEVHHTTGDLSILYPTNSLPFIFHDDNTLEVYGHQENLLLSYILM